MEVAEFQSKLRENVGIPALVRSRPAKTFSGEARVFTAPGLSAGGDGRTRFSSFFVLLLVNFQGLSLLESIGE